MSEGRLNVSHTPEARQQTLKRSCYSEYTHEAFVIHCYAKIEINGLSAMTYTKWEFALDLSTHLGLSTIGY